MRRIRLAWGCLFGAWAASTAHAHSASDAYLELSVGAPSRNGQVVLRGQWDIALRDLDFVLKLDSDGDGQVTWGEVKRHQAAIEQYAYAHLRFGDRSGKSCSIKPTRQMIDGHADGAYAALFFDVVCTRMRTAITMDYGLFFAVDPSHRGIVVIHAGDDVSTAVLSPQNATIAVNR
jgi:hypothetical protein